MVRVYGLLVFSAVLATSAAFAGNIESWNADSTAFLVNGSPSTCTLTPNASIESSDVHSGAGAMRVNVGDVQGDHGCETNPRPSLGDMYDGGTLYYRWWMKISPGFNWGTYEKKLKVGRITRSNEQNPIMGTWYLNSSGFFWAGHVGAVDNQNPHIGVDFDDSDGSCHSSDLVSNLGSECTQWREYIVRMQKQTCPTCADGSFSVYVNGQLAAQKDNMEYADGVPADGVTTITSSFFAIGGIVYPQMCPNGSTCGTGGTIWIDDVSLDTTWNSTFAPQPDPPRSLSAN